MNARNAEVAQLLAAAGSAQQAGRADLAADKLREVLRIQPDQPQALNSLGVRALNAGQAVAAVDYFARALKVDPSEPALWLNLAKAQRILGDDEAERASLDSALTIDQRHFMALVRKAELHERLGEEAQANHKWWAVLQIAPALDQRTPALDALFAHAQAYVDARSKSFEAAIQEGLASSRERLDAAERRRFDACIDHVLGKRRIFAPEPAALHFPFLPADEFHSREHFPWMEELEAATPRIAEEVRDLLANDPDAFQPYVSQQPGTPANKWTELDRTTKWGAYYLFQFGERNEEALSRCPATAAALGKVPIATLPRRAPTAFFSILQPRTRIPAHTGVTNIRATVHLPLIVPDGCGFRVGGETRQWQVGKAFAFDDSIEHEAWNDSDELRAVLILDVWNPHLTEAERSMLSTFYATADESGHNPEPGGGL